ncbi:uncharacterized protein LOC141641761 [Silene latifolia]|uniref:uncharacterized protein LOC141641761 n=1 Tax=Silene latifolia TaxID=37657 RepID=UPI003D777670
MSSLVDHDMIGEINPEKGSWKIKGRIIYSWEQIVPKTTEVTILDFVITDSEGTYIHATIPKKWMFKFKPDNRRVSDVIGKLLTKSKIDVNKDLKSMQIRLLDCESTQLELKPTSSMLTHLSTHSKKVENELLDLSARRTLAEIREIQEEEHFVTLATITAIDTDFKWYLDSCKTCRSSVELDDTGRWLSGKCEGYAKFVVPRCF